MKANETITNTIIESLEKGVIPWKKPWSVDSEPKNLISDKTYSGINYFLLSMQSYTSNYYLTYKQSVALGGNVVKGQKGIKIIYCSKVSKVDKITKEKDSFTFLKQYTVFNVEQCENLNHKLIDAERIKENQNEDFCSIENAENIINNFKTKPIINHAESRAYYRPVSDDINMPKKSEFVNSEEYYSTLFHELTHSTGHKSRLNREEVSKGRIMFGSSDYSKEELVAELGSAFLCAHAGIDNTLENSTAYIQSWLKVLKSKDNSTLLTSAASKAQKAFDYIISN